MNEVGLNSVLDVGGEQIVLRHCRQGDALRSISFLKRVAQQTSFTNHFVGNEYPAIETIDSKWENALNSEHEVHLGAFSNEVMVGQLVCWKPEPHHPILGSNAKFGMMVDQEFWGSGLADKLINMMEEFIRLSKIERVEATVRSENIRGRKFYQRHGFVEEGIRKRCAFIHETWQDEIYIAKLFPTTSL